RPNLGWWECTTTGMGTPQIRKPTCSHCPALTAEPSGPSSEGMSRIGLTKRRPRWRKSVNNVVLGGFRNRSSNLAGPGEPPHDGGMEARVAKLESANEHILREL